MLTDRFFPRKRKVRDGRTWFFVWDCKAHNWSTYLCHGRYKTRKAAQFAIDYNARYYGVM